METKGRKQYTLLMGTKQQLTELEARHTALQEQHGALEGRAAELEREAAQLRDSEEALQLALEVKEVELQQAQQAGGGGELGPLQGLLLA